MSDRLTLWYKAARGYTFGLSVIPYLLGAFLASINYEFHLRYCVLGLIGVLLVHASFNLLDDYKDWITGQVKTFKNPNFPKNTRKHKAFYLEEGLISVKELKFAILYCWTVALFIGVFLTWAQGFIIIQLAILGALFAFAYTLPPLELNSKGLGEITIGFIFGPLLVTGAYMTAGICFFDNLCLITSVIMGILIANTAHTHSILDYEADLKNDKRTLSVCLLNKDKAIYIQLLLYVLALLFLLLGISYEIYPVESLLAMFTLPLAIELNELMYSDSTEHKLWYGPITQLKNNIDNYFMLRLCLARNIVMFFAFFLALTCYLYE